jgi:hypothetical protein
MAMHAASSDISRARDLQAEIEALRQGMQIDRGRLDSQRRRVEALFWEGSEAEESKIALDLLERSYTLMEVYLHQLTALAEGGTLLQPFDLDQRARQFGVSAKVLEEAVAKAGPDLARVEALLESQPREKFDPTAQMNGPPRPNQRRRVAQIQRAAR